MTEHSLEAALVGVTAELSGLTKAVDALSDHVGQQNGRISKVETKCAAAESMAVSGATEHGKLDGRMDNMDERVKNLESSRDVASGQSRASLGIFREVLAILTLVVATWAIWNRPAMTVATPAPAAQHQVK